jgi:glycerophosphoryl diester phosphodiesterase
MKQKQRKNMWPYPKVVAHRGGGTLAPENTLAGLRCGLAHGFYAVELDVMLSKDEIPVLMHDSEFGRTVSGVGQVSETAATDLLRMDAGKWFAAHFAGETVPSYQQVLEFTRQQGIWMNVEIKPVPGFEVRTGEVVAKMTQDFFAKELSSVPLHLSSLPLFSSFSYEALMAAKAVAPAIPRGYLCDVVPADWREQLSQLQASAIHTNHKTLTPDLVAELKQAGYGVFCYTINEPQRAREVLGWGVDAFCTDRIDLIAAEF